MTDLLGLVFDLSPLADAPLFGGARVTPPTLDPPPLRDDVRAVARRGWEDRTRAEYVGVMIVRKLHGLLVDVNAPMDLQELALLMMLQEQRHAALCMAAARALGSDGEVAFDLEELRQARGSEPPEAELWRMVCGTYAIGEVTALALLRHAIRSLPPSGFRDVLRQIARDEVLHGRIGPALLGAYRSAASGATLGYPGDDVVRRTATEQLAFMRARDVVEPDESALFDDEEAAAQLMAVGIPPSRALKAAYLRALDDDVARAFEGAGISLHEQRTIPE